MKARVYKSGNWWYGQVYAEWTFFSDGPSWRNVTSNCYTRIGATIALKYWLSQHKVYNINI